MRALILEILMICKYPTNHCHRCSFGTLQVHALQAINPHKKIVEWALARYFHYSSLSEHRKARVKSGFLLDAYAHNTHNNAHAQLHTRTQSTKNYASTKS
jgi:hypothetical protein